MEVLSGLWRSSTSDTDDSHAQIDVVLNQHTSVYAQSRTVASAEHEEALEQISGNSPEPLKAQMKTERPSM